MCDVIGHRSPGDQLSYEYRGEANLEEESGRVSWRRPLVDTRIELDIWRRIVCFMDCFNSFILHTKYHGIHTHSDCPNELVLFLTRFQVAAKPGGLSPGHV